MIKYFFLIFLILPRLAVSAAIPVGATGISAYGATSSAQVIQFPGAVASGGSAGEAAAASTGAAPLFVGAVALGVGTYLGYVLIDNMFGDSVRVPLGDESVNPNSKIPPPSAAASTSSTSSPSQQYAHWNTMNPILCPYQNNALGCFNSDYAVATNICIQAGGSQISGSWQCYYNGAWRTLAIDNITPPNSCPSGYSLQPDNTCALTDPYAATPPDHACDLKKVNGVFTNIATDPDCNSGPNKIPQACLNLGAQCTWTGYHDYGDGNWTPTRLTINNLPDGSTEVITEYQQNVPGSSSQVVQDNYHVNSSGVVDSASQNVQAGSVSSNPSTQTQTSGNPVTQSQSGQTQNITFPSDYARVGEASQAAASLSSAITPKLDTLHNDLSTVHNDLSNTASVADPVVPQASAMPDFGTTFDGLKGWTLPAHSSQCPSGQFDFSAVLGPSALYKFDVHCQLFDQHMAQIRAAFLVVWSLASIFIILRA